MYVKKLFFFKGGRFSLTFSSISLQAMAIYYLEQFELLFFTIPTISIYILSAFFKYIYIAIFLHFYSFRISQHLLAKLAFLFSNWSFEKPIRINRFFLFSPTFRLLCLQDEDISFFTNFLHVVVYIYSTTVRHFSHGSSKM